MSRNHVIRSIARTLALGTLVTLSLAGAAQGGGIQMSAERVEAPFPRNTNGTVLYVNTFECGRAHDFKLEATAEGIVGGERSSIPLAVTSAGREGRFSIARQWPLEGEWLLIVTTEAWNHTANLVVRLELNGGFVPSAGAKDGSGFIEMTGSETVHGKLDARAVEAIVAGKPIDEKTEVRKISLGDWLAAAIGL